MALFVLFRKAFAACWILIVPAALAQGISFPGTGTGGSSSADLEALDAVTVTTIADFETACRAGGTSGTSVKLVPGSYTVTATVNLTDLAYLVIDTTGCTFSTGGAAGMAGKVLFDLTGSSRVQWTGGRFVHTSASNRPSIAILAARKTDAIVWTGTTAFTVGTARTNYCHPTTFPTTLPQYRFKCIQAGSTGGSEPDWASAPDPNSITDGTVIWQQVAANPPSAGEHSFNHMRFSGQWEVAPFVCVASEANRWNDCEFVQGRPTSGGPQYAVVVGTGFGDIQGTVGGLNTYLGASSMIGAVFQGCSFLRKPDSGTTDDSDGGLYLGSGVTNGGVCNGITVHDSFFFSSFSTITAHAESPLADIVLRGTGFWKDLRVTNCYSEGWAKNGIFIDVTSGTPHLQNATLIGNKWQNLHRMIGAEAGAVITEAVIADSFDSSVDSSTSVNWAYDTDGVTIVTSGNSRRRAIIDVPYLTNSYVDMRATDVQSSASSEGYVVTGDTIANRNSATSDHTAWSVGRVRTTTGGNTLRAPNRTDWLTPESGTGSGVIGVLEIVPNAGNVMNPFGTPTRTHTYGYWGTGPNPTMGGTAPNFTCYGNTTLKTHTTEFGKTTSMLTLDTTDSAAGEYALAVIDGYSASSLANGPITWISVSGGIFSHRFLTLSTTGTGTGSGHRIWGPFQTGAATGITTYMLGVRSDVAGAGTQLTCPDNTASYPLLCGWDNAGTPTATFAVNHDGGLWWGSDSTIGTGSAQMPDAWADTNLYRASANNLKTDDNLTVVGTLQNTGFQYIGGAPGGAGVVTKFTVTKTAVTDATATAIIVFTVPNVDAGAIGVVNFAAVLAGSDPGEMVATRYTVPVSIGRKAGAAAEGNVITGGPFASERVGAGQQYSSWDFSLTQTASGATSVNTFELKVTVDADGTNQPSNITVWGDVCNVNGGGITIAAAP